MADEARQLVGLLVPLEIGRVRVLVGAVRRGALVPEYALVLGLLVPVQRLDVRVRLAAAVVPALVTLRACVRVHAQLPLGAEAPAAVGRQARRGLVLGGRREVLRVRGEVVLELLHLVPLLAFGGLAAVAPAAGQGRLGRARGGSPEVGVLQHVRVQRLSGPERLAAQGKVGRPTPEAAKQLLADVEVDLCGRGCDCTDVKVGLYRLGFGCIDIDIGL